MKTALQTLDEWLKWKQDNATPHSNYIFGLVRGQAEQLFSIEQQAIEEAHLAGFEQSETFVTPNQYFEEKYCQPKALQTVE